MPGSDSDGPSDGALWPCSPARTCFTTCPIDPPRFFSRQLVQRHSNLDLLLLPSPSNPSCENGLNSAVDTKTHLLRRRRFDESLDSSRTVQTVVFFGRAFEREHVLQHVQSTPPGLGSLQGSQPTDTGLFVVRHPS